MGLFGPERSALDRGLDAFTARNWKKARKHLEEAAQAEHPRPLGDYHLGLLYWRGLGGERDQKEAVRYFRRAAESGHAAAETALGIALAAGAGTPQHLEAARALFRSAAGAGDPEAMTQLAALSEREDARRLLERACDAGHAPAMLRYADFLIEESPGEALSWLYAHVALTSDEDAAKHAEKLAHELSAAEIDAAQARGRAFLKRLKQERSR